MGFAPGALVVVVVGGIVPYVPLFLTAVLVRSRFFKSVHVSVKLVILGIVAWLLVVLASMSLYLLVYFLSPVNTR